MKELFEIVLLGLILSVDSFSAAIAMGLKPHRHSDALKFASLSAGAELIASFAGAIAGGTIIAKLGYLAQWIGFLLLAMVAGHMLYEGFIEWKDRDKGNPAAVKFHGFFKLLIVAFATSLDALAVGVSLGVSNKPLAPFLVSICAWAFIMTLVGMSIAKQAPERLSAVFNIFGAVILFIIAFEVI